VLDPRLCQQFGRDPVGQLTDIGDRGVGQPILPSRILHGGHFYLDDRPTELAAAIINRLDGQAAHR
ncbi:hypothetical protein GV794_29110, partial [Nocardia cyriacigeorgica]